MANTGERRCSRPGSGAEWRPSAGRPSPGERCAAAAPPPPAPAPAGCSAPAAAAGAAAGGCSKSAWSAPRSPPSSSGVAGRFMLMRWRALRWSRKQRWWGSSMEGGTPTQRSRAWFGHVGGTRLCLAAWMARSEHIGSPAPLVQADLATSGLIFFFRARSMTAARGAAGGIAQATPFDRLGNAQGRQAAACQQCAARSRAGCHPMAQLRTGGQAAQGR